MNSSVKFFEPTFTATFAFAGFFLMRFAVAVPLVFVLLSLLPPQAANASAQASGAIAARRDRTRGGLISALFLVLSWESGAPRPQVGLGRAQPTCSPPIRRMGPSRGKPVCETERFESQPSRRRSSSPVGRPGAEGPRRQTPR